MSLPLLDMLLARIRAMQHPDNRTARKPAHRYDRGIDDRGMDVIVPEDIAAENELRFASQRRPSLDEIHMSSTDSNDSTETGNTDDSIETDSD